MIQVKRQRILDWKVRPKRIGTFDRKAWFYVSRIHDYSDVPQALYVIGGRLGWIKTQYDIPFEIKGFDDNETVYLFEINEEILSDWNGVSLRK